MSIYAYRYPLLQISLFLFDILPESKPSENPTAGHYRPASETPFGWRFANRPVVPRFYVHPGKFDRDYPHSIVNGIHLTEVMWPLLISFFWRSNYYDIEMNLPKYVPFNRLKLSVALK